ncbi:MAG: flagellar hook-basal body complex protein [Opitutaceae bacterium]|jgi:flagellar hook protein FlgE
MALIGTLSSGVSALKVFTKDLEVIGDNIANVNTTAFKSSKVSISDDFSNTLRASQPGNGGSISNVQAAQIGSGVKLAGITVNYNQGALSTTGQGTDLGISGEGYFLVKDGNGSVFATRSGSFRWDDQGYLVNSQGMRVQGLTGNSTTPPTTNVGDIQRDTAALASTATLQSISIDRGGNIVQFYSDGTNATVGQIMLQQFNQTSSLMKRGDGLYTSLTNAGPKGADGIFTTAATVTTAADYQAGGAGGAGTVEAGTLELSNVDLTEQFANMITAQRSFQAASRLVTVSDSMLEEIVNLKRS